MLSESKSKEPALEGALIVCLMMMRGMNEVRGEDMILLNMIMVRGKVIC